MSVSIQTYQDAINSLGKASNATREAEEIAEPIKLPQGFNDDMIEIRLKLDHWRAQIKAAGKR